MGLRRHVLTLFEIEDARPGVGGAMARLDTHGIQIGVQGLAVHVLGLVGPSQPIEGLAITRVETGGLQKIGHGGLIIPGVIGGTTLVVIVHGSPAAGGHGLAAGQDQTDDSQEQKVSDEKGAHLVLSLSLDIGG